MKYNSYNNIFNEISPIPKMSITHCIIIIYILNGSTLEIRKTQTSWRLLYDECIHWSTTVVCPWVVVKMKHLFVIVKWVGVRGFSKMVATFNHVGGFFILFMATTGGVWIIPSFGIWSYVLHGEHISFVITNCGQHQWVIPSLFSIALEDLLEENITKNYYPYLFFFKILLFQFIFRIFFSVVILLLSFLLTFFLLGCYCSMWLYFSPGN